MGTKIRKKNPEGWFNGLVDDFQVDADGVCWWRVIYEDGDSEFMTKQQLHETFVGRRVEKRFQSQYFYGKVTLLSPADDEFPNDLWKVVYNDEDVEEYTFSELNAILVVGEEDSPLPPPLSTALVVGARKLSKALPALTVDPPSPQAFISKVHNTLSDYEVTSYGAYEDNVSSNDSSAAQQEHTTAAPAMPDQKPQARKASAEHEANMDRAEALVAKSFRCIEEGLKAFYTSSQDDTPTTKKRKGAPPPLTGRFVFRRSHGLAGPKEQPGLTTLLGGDARQAWPVVTKAVSPFVKKSDFYVAHRGDWNPWGPRWAGEDGLLPVEAFADTQHSGSAKNKTFHLFEQCHRSPGHPRYHGPSAAGSFVYAGEYQRVVDGDIMEEAIEFNKPEFVHTQWAMAELTQQQRAAVMSKNRPWQKIIADANGNTHVVENVSEVHFKMARVNNEADWEDWSQIKRETAAWVELFIAKEWIYRTVAVECVGYNENLYNKLVEIGASNGRLPAEEEAAEYE